MTEANSQESSSENSKSDTAAPPRATAKRRVVVLAIAALAIILAAAVAGYTLNKARRIAPELREKGWIALDAPVTAAVPYVWDEDGVPLHPRHPWRFTPKEQALIADAEARIPALRRGEARVTLLDESGAPLPAGVRVSYALIKHQFLFGADDWPLPEFDQMRRRIGVNTLWTPSPWRELQRGGGGREYDFRFPEQCYARPWRAAAGFTTVLHPVIWLIKTKYDGAQMHSRIPDYFFFDVRPSEQKAVLLDHVRAMAAYSKGRYDIVNLLNEPVNDWANPLDWDWREEMLPFFAEAFQEFRKINPDSALMVNLAGPFLGPDEISVTGPELIQYLVDHDARPDWIGLEIWANGVFPWKLPMGYLSVEHIAVGLRDYQSFGIPIYLSEFATPESGEPYGHWKWTPERQELYVRAIMSIAYGTPGVGGINYFQTHDTFMAESGLLDSENNPRPILAAMESIMNAWTTEGESTTAEGGRVDVAGFGGLYAITATDPASGRKWRYTASVPEGARVEVSLSPDAPCAPAPPEYAALAPVVCAEHVLDVSLEAISPDEAGGHPGVETGEFSFLHDLFIHYAIERESEDVFVVRDSRGFLPAGVPAGGGRFICDLQIESEAGRLDVVQVVSGERRWFMRDVADGSWRMQFDVRAGERPTVFTIFDDSTATIRVVSPRFVAGGE